MVKVHLISSRNGTPRCNKEKGDLRNNFGVALSCLWVCYLFTFRSKSLNIYHWCCTLGLSSSIDILREHVQNWDISEFVKYSFPDGLYCAAYILIIDVIWRDDNRIVKYIIISLVPFVTISSEGLQYFGLVKGTFDVYDLICYTIPPAMYLIYIFHLFKFNIIKIQRL